jgi:quercetin dioxygenase-like cupin family protein
MKPEPKVIKIEMGDKEYVRLLGGPPESLLMRSGAVALQPGRTVGKHTTGVHEELLIVLEGEGSLLLGEDGPLEMKVGTVLYCPPDTDHDVQNTGPDILSYLYVIAKTR